MSLIKPGCLVCLLASSPGTDAPPHVLLWRWIKLINHWLVSSSLMVWMIPDGKGDCIKNSPNLLRLCLVANNSYFFTVLQRQSLKEAKLLLMKSANWSANPWFRFRCFALSQQLLNTFTNHDLYLLFCFVWSQFNFTFYFIVSLDTDH